MAEESTLVHRIKGGAEILSAISAHRLEVPGMVGDFSYQIQDVRSAIYSIGQEEIT